MTAQVPETITYQNKTRSLLSCPLCNYFSLIGSSPAFDIKSTALWRGYQGRWEIQQDRLYLIALKATCDDGREVILQDIFPSFVNRVFAHWYTGELRIPDGDLINYEHNGFGSDFERDILIQVKQGVITKISVKDNVQGEEW